MYPITERKATKRAMLAIKLMGPSRLTPLMYENNINGSSGMRTIRANGGAWWLWLGDEATVDGEVTFDALPLCNVDGTEDTVVNIDAIVLPMNIKYPTQKPYCVARRAILTRRTPHFPIAILAMSPYCIRFSTVSLSNAAWVSWDSPSVTSDKQTVSKTFWTAALLHLITSWQQWSVTTAITRIPTKPSFKRKSG